ncbi:neprilysin [Orussus abietinus]|uniref:neprilysin n=1 Tax=Orussus abietinus TaxID=222816 RepID=UPI00062684E0|nr:neprilysin [Orussus abietinus]
MLLTFLIFGKDIRICIVDFIFLVYLAILVAAQYKRPPLEPFPPKETTTPNIARNISLCKEEACMELGRDIKENMNFAVNPCDDFYEFVCGNWPNRFPNVRSFNQFDRAEQVANERIKEIIEEQPRNDIDSLRKAKEWHKICVDDETLSRKGVEPIEKILNKLGGWPTIHPKWRRRNWQDINNYYTILSGGISPFYRIEANADLESDSPRVMLKLSPPKFLIPSYVLLEPVANEEKFIAYTDLFRTIVDIFLQSSNVHIDPDVITTDLNRMLVLEMYLTQATKHDKTAEPTSSTRITISELQYRYNEINRNNRISRINWMDVFQKVVEMAGLQIDKWEEVDVTNIDYFDILPIILYLTSERVIVNYIHWQFIARWIHYTTPALRETFRCFANKITSDANNVPRWQECIDLNPYYRAIVYEYLRKYVPDSNLKTFERILNNIKFAMDQQISNANWMDEQSKNATRAKLMSLSATLGSPPTYRNPIDIDRFYEQLPTEPNEFFENMMNQKKAIFSRSLVMNNDDRLDDYIWQDMFVKAGASITDKNKLFFYAPLLSKPLFVSGSSNILQLYNYGSVGSMIGHEFGHGFDEVARMFNKQVPLWSQDTTERFKEIRSCLVQQYSSYNISEIKNVTTGQPINENGEKTINENFSDGIGLRAAFAAFQAESKNLPLERIPYLEEFDHNQLFFISNANVWCEHMSQDLLRSTVLESQEGREHSLWYLRVNGVISNMEDFSKSFKCKPNDKMNPPHKCKMW